MAKMDFTKPTKYTMAISYSSSASKLRFACGVKVTSFICRYMPEIKQRGLAEIALAKSVIDNINRFEDSIASEISAEETRSILSIGSADLYDFYLNEKKDVPIIRYALLSRSIPTTIPFDAKAELRKLPDNVADWGSVNKNIRGVSLNNSPFEMCVYLLGEITNTAEHVGDAAEVVNIFKRDGSPGANYSLKLAESYRMFR